MKEIIKKWYEKLSFPKEYDEAFHTALKDFEFKEITPEKYESKSGMENLMYFLYFCENLHKKYRSAGIDESIFYATLRDVVYWTRVWTEIKGELYLGETHWLKNHMEMKIFTLGRLQFSFGKAECDIPEYKILKGDKMLEIHIPDGGRLDNNECIRSLSMAKEFFFAYYPEYEYKGITCHSWVLASELGDILDKDSNIIKFQKMFEIITEEESFDMLKYLFRHDATGENLHTFPVRSALAEEIRERVDRGNALHVAYGIISG